MIHNQQIIDLYQQASEQPLVDTNHAGVSQFEFGAYDTGMYIIFQTLVDRKGQFTCRYKVFGCGFTIALCVWLAQTLEHKGLSQVCELQFADIIEHFNLPETKHKCAMALFDLIQQLCNHHAL